MQSFLNRVFGVIAILFRFLSNNFEAKVIVYSVPLKSVSLLRAGEPLHLLKCARDQIGKRSQEIIAPEGTQDWINFSMANGTYTYPI